MSSKVAQIVTDKIIAALDAGVVPWRRPWNTRGLDIARNAWGKPYRGINVFLLAGSRLAQGFKSNTWLTFKQVQAQGGTVRPGAKSTLVVFWKVGQETINPDTGKKQRPFILRYFNVFNLDQTHGVVLTKAQERAQHSDLIDIDADELSPIDDAEAIVASYFVRDGAPTLREGADRAFYTPADDTIVVPGKDQYVYRGLNVDGGDVEPIVGPEYYSTLFHEIGHSTGHAKRLNREGVTGFDHFGSGQYAFEELVAELSSAYLCAESGINNTLVNSAAYIANWKARLADDPNLIIRAAGKAQKVLDYVLGNEQKGGDDE